MRVLVTGASRGIGASVAKYFSKQTTCQLALLARSYNEPSHHKLTGSLLDTKKEVEKNGSFALAVKCDMSDGVELSKSIKDVMNIFGGLDVLINNTSMLMLDKNPKISKRNAVHNVNTRATMICIEECLKELEKNKGSIVTISPPIKLEKIKWIEDHPCYTISKYSMTLATLGASNTVRANTIWPKRTISTAATKMLEEQGLSQTAYTNGRNPDEFAKAVYEIATKKYSGNMFLDEDIIKMSPSTAPLDLYV